MVIAPQRPNTNPRPWLDPSIAPQIVVDGIHKRYGAFVADTGSNWYFSGATDSRWNDDDLQQLQQVPGTAFEVVRSGALQHRR